MQYVICGGILAKESMKPSKLKYHLHAEFSYMCIHQVYVQFAYDDREDELVYFFSLVAIKHKL